MKHDTPQKLKFKKLQKRLGLPLWQAVGLLETLWIVTYTNTQAGDIGKLSNEDIALLIEWDGDPDELIKALIHTGFLDEDPEFRLIIHDWSQHCANFLKGNFKKHNRRFADEVAKQRASEPTNNATKQGARQSTKHGATKPNLTQPDPTKPMTTASAVVCDEPRSEASPPPPENIPSAPEDTAPLPAPPPDNPPDAPPKDPPDNSVTMIFAIKGDKQWELTQAKRDEYEVAFPNLDVNGELAKARQWCTDNPKKRKTASGMTSFLNGWLNKASSNGQGHRDLPTHSNEKRSSELLECHPLSPDDPRINEILGPSTEEVRA